LGGDLALAQTACVARNAAGRQGIGRKTEHGLASRLGWLRDEHRGAGPGHGCSAAGPRRPSVTRRLAGGKSVAAPAAEPDEAKACAAKVELVRDGPVSEVDAGRYVPERRASARVGERADAHGVNCAAYQGGRRFANIDIERDAPVALDLFPSGDAARADRSPGSGSTSQARSCCAGAGRSGLPVRFDRPPEVTRFVLGVGRECSLTSTGAGVPIPAQNLQLRLSRARFHRGERR
jgi:hypothetical protein